LVGWEILTILRGAGEAAVLQEGGGGVDILSLVEEKRLLRFWPIVMLDANGTLLVRKRRIGMTILGSS